MSRNTSPRLRFGGFAGEWEEKKLGEISTSYSGGTPSVANSQFYGGEIPFIRSGEIHKSKTELFLTKEGLENSSAKLVEKGNILYALYGATSGEVGRSKINGAINQAILAIIPNKNYDAEFISQWLSTNKENIVNLYLQGGQGNLSGEIVKNIEIPFPLPEEQTALGNFFRRLDETLAQARARLAKTQQLKRAMLAKLFPAHGETAPKLRFKGFSGDWERKMLGDLAEIVRGASPRPIQDPKWFDDDSDIGWLRIADVSNQNGRIHYLEQKISKAGQEKTRVLEEPHLLLSIAASVGKPVINYVKTGVHDGFLIFKNPKFELEFMFQYLDSFADKWQSFGQPGTQVNLNSDIVKNAELFIPPTPEEQTAIGNFFQKLDQTLALQNAALEKLTNLKKALLAAMLV